MLKYIVYIYTLRTG